MRCKRRKESKFYARIRGLRLIPHEAVEKIMNERCDACLKKAVPVEGKPTVALIGKHQLDPAEAESILEYAKLRFPEKFKND